MPHRPFQAIVITTHHCLGWFETLSEALDCVEKYPLEDWQIWKEGEVVRSGKDYEDIPG